MENLHFAEYNFVEIQFVNIVENIFADLDYAELQYWI